MVLLGQMDFETTILTRFDMMFLVKDAVSTVVCSIS